MGSDWLMCCCYLDLAATCLSTATATATAVIVYQLRYRAHGHTLVTDDSMAEWLRRWTKVPMQASVPVFKSRPRRKVHFYLFFSSFIYLLTSCSVAQRRAPSAHMSHMRKAPAAPITFTRRLRRIQREKTGRVSI